eukprot:3765572-Prorocentrum_lima.AAC.1
MAEHIMHSNAWCGLCKCGERRRQKHSFQHSAALPAPLVVTVTPSAFMRAFGGQRQPLEFWGGPCQLFFR